MRRLLLPILIVSLFVCSCDVTPPEAHYERSVYNLSMVDGEVVADKDWVKTVYREEGEDFVILNFTDIQFGSTAFLLDFGTVSEMMDRIVAEVQPDLITVTGDISYGCGIGFYGICSHIDGYGVPWAPVYGNHDFGESDLTVEEQADILQHYGNCLFANGPSGLAYDDESGKEMLGNYIVNIVERDGEDFEVVRSLVMMDSGQSGITQLQMQWYEDCVQSVEAPTAVFMHIPVHGFYLANKAAIKNRYVSIADTYTHSSDVWKTGYEDSFGMAYSTNGPSRADGFDPLMESLGSTDLVVCGHFHHNCSCVKYHGITYLYSLKTGCGHSYYADVCGATSITVGSDGLVTVEHRFDTCSPYASR